LNKLPRPRLLILGTVVAVSAPGAVKQVDSNAVRLRSYDAPNGKARLATKATVKAGDVIASGASPQLPNGALVKVTDPTPDSTGAVSVRPATLPELLGDAKITSTTPVRPSDVTIKPLRKGVAAAVTPSPVLSKGLGPAPLPSRGPGGRLPVGQVSLDLDVPLADLGFTPATQGGPTLAGWVRFQPEIIFSYQRDHGAGSAPSQAAIGVGGPYDYGWKVHASLPASVDTGRQPLRPPFAEVHLRTVLMVAGFPIVIDVDLTYFYQVSATGRIAIDAEQKMTGDLSLGAAYAKDSGWTALPLDRPTGTAGSKPKITGATGARATIGAQLSVALYGIVGAALVWGPYLRADVGARIPNVDWSLYAGYELTAELFVRLDILGVPIPRQSVQLPPLTGEWKLAGGMI